MRTYSKVKKTIEILFVGLGRKEPALGVFPCFNFLSLFELEEFDNHSYPVSSPGGKHNRSTFASVWF